MNFRDLFKSWRGEGILSQTLDEFVAMIDDCHWMFQRAATSLWEKTDVKKRIKELYERDIKVNKAERSIRKKVVEHLAINPGRNANYCLVLMSVLKDAERVGDYCKNLIEVSEYHPTYEDSVDLIADFKDIQAEVETMFRKVGKAFRESDEKIGRELVLLNKKVSKECAKLITRVLEHDTLIVPQAVCYTLLARYFKRISAHLGNIASSLVMPVHKLDYYDEKHLPESKTKKKKAKKK